PVRPTSEPSSRCGPPPLNLPPGIPFVRANRIHYIALSAVPARHAGDRDPSPPRRARERRALLGGPRPVERRPRRRGPEPARVRAGARVGPGRHREEPAESRTRAALRGGQPLGGRGHTGGGI